MKTAIQKEAEQLVEATLAECMSVAKSHRDVFDHRFSVPELTMSWAANRTRSRGGVRRGKPIVSIAMGCHVPTEIPEVEGYYMTEYSHIRNSKRIGAFHSVDWRDVVKAVVCHEVAHSIQYQPLYQFNQFYQKPHGDGWRTLYGKLRDELVNGSQHIFGRGCAR